MIIVNHECYVSFEIAKLLREAGFDWECHSNYQNDVFKEFQCSSYFKVLIMDFNNAPNYMNQYSAPTLEVAQRWLREIKNIDVYIFPTTNTKRECVYQVGIKTFGRTLWIPGQSSTAQYDTYEEAQEAGIKKALEIILEKEE